MALKEGDFVTLTYTARTKEGSVYDTTDEDIAKKEGLGDRGPFGPQTICLGQGFLLMGLETKLIGKELGKQHIELTAVEAFGRKDPKRIRLFPTNKFIEQEVLPEPGTLVTMDGVVGMIRTVSGGRTTVDFNHPLAGKDVVYDVDVQSVVSDAAEKVKTLAYHTFGPEVPTAVADNVATFTLERKLPEQLADQFRKKIVQLTGVKDVTFAVKAEEKEAGAEKIEQAQGKKEATQEKKEPMQEKKASAPEKKPATTPSEQQPKP
jgi:FKBP-type peptidyl-prolyl cis-trans isomerase 2